MWRGEQSGCLPKTLSYQTEPELRREVEPRHALGDKHRATLWTMAKIYRVELKDVFFRQSLEKSHFDVIWKKAGQHVH